METCGQREQKFYQSNERLKQQIDFALEVDTVSGDFSSELPCAKKDGRYVCGSGTGVYEIDTTSGDIRMQRGGV